MLMQSFAGSSRSSLSILHTIKAYGSNPARSFAFPDSRDRLTQGAFYPLCALSIVDFFKPV